MQEREHNEEREREFKEARLRKGMANSLDHLSSRTRLEWLSGLNTEFHPEKNFRRTSIICTIGKLLTGCHVRKAMRKPGKAN